MPATVAKPDRADVVVVGAGAAGAAAFLEASDRGAAVIGVDLLPAFGGTAQVSGGGCCIPATPLQSARGIRDSPELALRDLIAAGDGDADETWGRFYLEHAFSDVYEWLISLGVEFVDLRPQEFNTVPRWHLPRGNGRGIMESLWSDVVRRQSATDWRWSTTVEELLVDNGRAVGVIVRDEAGHRSELRSQSVILATGGFAGDLDVVLDHAPHLRAVERLLVGGGVGARGTGHAMLAKLGAALDHLDHIWTYTYAIPDYREPSGRRGLVVRGLDDAIWVNRSGHRFHDESRPGPGSATPALLAQDPPTCWAIVDRQMALGMRIADPAFRTTGASAEDRIAELLTSSPSIHNATSPDALARAAGIAPDAFTATLHDWNARVASGAGSDPLTGRSLAGLRPLTGSPLYAIQFYPLVRKNLGGVRTDLRCRVLDTAGSPIPGLFAAGELAGFGGGHLSGRRALEGIMIGGSLFGGRIAGAMAAEAAGFGPTEGGPTALRSLA